MMISEEIERLHALHLAGALSAAEFERAKARLLGGGAAPAASGVAALNRLRRVRDGRWLGGVCGGLARLSGIDAWLWRLLFVLFTLTFGFGLVLYILLWFFVPDEVPDPRLEKHE